MSCRGEHAARTRIASTLASTFCSIAGKSRDTTKLIYYFRVILYIDKTWNDSVLLQSNWNNLESKGRIHHVQTYSQLPRLPHLEVPASFCTSLTSTAFWHTGHRPDTSVSQGSIHVFYEWDNEFIKQAWHGY